jgi:hypothetical protein
MDYTFYILTIIFIITSILIHVSISIITVMWFYRSSCWPGASIFETCLLMLLRFLTMARENDTTEAQIFTGILTQPVQSRIRLKRLFSKQEWNMILIWLTKMFFLYNANLCWKKTHNNAKKKMHFEISERKMILRLFDVLCFTVLLCDIFDLDYSGALTNRYAFVMYLVFLFEMYYLQVAVE